MCLFPRIAKNKKYEENSKNRGVVPSVSDLRTVHIAYGCGNCIECRKQYARAWQVRLLEDIKDNTNGRMVTLTFSTEQLKKINNRGWITRTDKKTKRIEKIKIKRLKGYEKDNAIAKYAVRRFLERWRKEHGKSVRHWLVTELGHKNTEHIHLHGIIWAEGKLEEVMNKIERIWQYGWIFKGNWEMGRLTNYVNERTVNYSIKYIYKTDKIHRLYKSKVLCSKGIGSNYTCAIEHYQEEWLHRDKNGKWTVRKYNKWRYVKRKSGNYKRNKFNGEDTEEFYRSRTGHKIALPIYWRNKIYSDDEKEALWIQKLNKEERWVMGEKISIKKEEETYYKALEKAREINKQLGYGTDKKEWKREWYELERREMIHTYRLKEQQ